MMKKWLIVIIICICFITVTSLCYIKAMPMMKTYGKMELERFHQLIISHSYLTDESQFDHLIVMEKDEKNQIQLLDFDMIKVNKLASDIVRNIEKTYTDIEMGNYYAKDQSYYEQRLEQVSHNGIVSHVPLSILFHIPTFHRSLISIPIKYKHLSKVGSVIHKKIENYGVNHVMVELSIEIKVDLVMIYPFYEQYYTQSSNIPILLEIFQGQAPTYYAR